MLENMAISVTSKYTLIHKQADILVTSAAITPVIGMVGMVQHKCSAFDNNNMQHAVLQVKFTF